MNFNIIPFTNVGNIKLNETREILRSQYYLESENDNEFQLEDFFKNLDYYFIATYNMDKILTAILLLKPSNPIFNNKELFNITYRECILFFQEIDEICYLPSGFISYKFGILIHSDFEYKNDKLKNPPTMIMAFRLEKFRKFMDEDKKSSYKWRSESGI